MIYITQLIFVNAGEEELYNNFEELVLPLLNKYAGKLLYRIKPAQKSFFAHGEELPYEIHIISFESESDFENFMADESRNKYLEMKNKSVRSSIIVKGSRL